MSDEAEQKLYGLIEIAEQQQSVAQAALDGLERERSALEQERKRLASVLGLLSTDIRTSVLAAITESMAGATEAGSEAVRGVTAELSGMLEDVSAQANEAELRLRTVVNWISWRLLKKGLAALAGLAVLGCLANNAVLWWDTSAIASAQLKKAELEAQIAELQADHDAWVNAGMLAKLQRCGPKKRNCVQVDDSAGSFGEHGDFRIILGY